MTKFKTTTVRLKDEEDAKLFAPANVDDDGFAESDNDLDVDDQRAHSNLISEISKISKRKRLAPAPRNVRANVEEGGTKVDSNDILERIGKKQLSSAAKKISTLPKPQEKVVLRRLKRAAGYEKVSIESEKWKSLVQHRRTTDQLQFPLQLPDIRVHTALKVEETRMKTPLEQEVYSLLLGAKMIEDKKETAEELMRKRAMSLEELKERNRLAWKLKAEKRKREYKAWQQNKNKSRKFHRLLRRDRLKKQRAELEQLEKTNPEAALERLEELERVRVTERMTLRHKQSKWAHLQGFRATRDPKAMAALKENRDMHQELLLKRKRQESSSEEEEVENIEEKLEALKKERQAAIEAGLFDPTNPWIANLLQQVPERLKVTPESAIDDSFVNFKKFWDEVNRRRLMEKKAQQIAEAKEQESKESGVSDDDGEYAGNSDGEMEAIDAEDGDNGIASKNYKDGIEQGNEEEDSVKKEETKIKEVTSNSSVENVKMEIGESGEQKLKKRKIKSEKKMKNKKIKTTDKIQEKQDNENSNTEKKDNEILENEVGKEKYTDSSGDIEEKGNAKDSNQNKAKKRKLKKKKKVIGCKSVKKSNVKDNGKGKKKKVSDKTKSGGKEENTETGGDDVQKEDLTKIVVENSSGKKKKKLHANQGKEKKKDVKNEQKKSKNSCTHQEKKKKKGNKIQDKKQENEDNRKENVCNGSSDGEKDDKETNNKAKEQKEEENKDVSDNDIDLEEQLISIDNMFNQAELGLQKKLKKRLERLGIKGSSDQEWTKVTSKKEKKTKKRMEKEDTEESKKSILPKIEEYSFETVKNQENIDEKLERAKTLEDMDKLQNAKEAEDEVQKAVKTLQAADKKEGSKKGSESDKKQASSKIVQVDPSKFIEVDAKKLLTAMPDTIGRGDEALDDDEEEDEAEDIIREAFADDYLVNEFKSDKDAAREEDKPKALCLALPGWGQWTGPNIKMSSRLRKRFTIRAPKAPPRKDDTLGNVIYNEKADVHGNLRKVMVNELPFPFSSVREFEASIRAPIGRLFVPEKQHQNLTAPPVVTKIGTIIEPMTEEELLKHEEKFKWQKGTKNLQRGNRETRHNDEKEARKNGRTQKST